MLKKSLDDFIKAPSVRTQNEYRETRVQQIRDRDSLLDDSIRNTGVPAKPSFGMAEDWSDFFSMTGTFVLLTLLFLLSMSYVVTGPGV